MKKLQLSADQIEFFERKTKEAFAVQPYLKKLRKHLLNVGGAAVVLWNGTNDRNTADKLVALGTAERGDKAILRRGKQSACHENSADLHRADPERYAVYTGYALSADGIWRPHSWVHDGAKSRIIETTERRTVYFGLVKFERRKPGEK
jgi:hypothetical protein